MGLFVLLSCRQFPARTRFSFDDASRARSSRSSCLLHVVEREREVSRLIDFTDARVTDASGGNLSQWSCPKCAPPRTQREQSQKNLADSPIERFARKNKKHEQFSSTLQALYRWSFGSTTPIWRKTPQSCATGVSKNLELKPFAETLPTNGSEEGNPNSLPEPRKSREVPDRAKLVRETKISPTTTGFPQIGALLQ